VSACCQLGLSLRTLKRWRRAFMGDGDGVDRRKGSPRLVSHRLSEEERQRIMHTCNQPEYASLPWDRSCQRWPIRASISVQNPVATGSCTRRGSANEGGGHVPHRNRDRCRASELTSRTRCGAGTSPTCLPWCVGSNYTSIW
jgi:hypothetical protein